jgi:hypothetical protein
MQLTRRGRLTVSLSVVAILLLTSITYVLTRTSVGTALGVPVAPPPCTVTVDGKTRSWSHGQAMTATTVTGVGMRIGASVNGVAAAVEAALAAGKDSPATDPAAARAVYRALPDRATPRPDSVALAGALLGYQGRALTCTVTSFGLGDSLPREDLGRLGLTPRADTLRLAMREVFGKQTLGGFEPNGGRIGHVDGSAHYEGRAIDVFFRPVTAANQRRGWAQAAWAVAHAEQLNVATVIFNRSIWSAGRSVSGWRDYQHPGGPTDNPILLHEDHVHVDVVEGG